MTQLCHEQIIENMISCHHIFNRNKHAFRENYTWLIQKGDLSVVKVFLKHKIILLEISSENFSSFNIDGDFMMANVAFSTTTILNN